jgi:hypothetical protein
MTTATAQVGDTTYEIDFSDVKKDIESGVDAKMKKYMEELKVYESKKKDERGRGVVETFMGDDKKKRLLEEFQKGEKVDPTVISEQWTIAVPRYTRYETAAHLRDFVFVTDVIKGNVGDTVNIPYVKDVEMEHLTQGTGSITEITGLVSTLTTTIHECGGYYDAYYSDIEKIDANLLDELNRVFAHAAVRAEDKLLMQLCEDATTADFHAAGSSGNTWINCGDYNVAGSTFEIRWIADAIGKLIAKGKDVHPGECLLVLNPAAYVTLLKKLSATTNTAVAYARPDIWQKGLIEEYLGVRIVVAGNVMGSIMASGIEGGATTYQVNFLMRPKRALALAPKRDILIETDKIIAKRTLRIVASHSFGVAAIDMTEVVPIWSGVTTMV